MPAWSAVPEIRLNENLIEADAEGGYLVVRRQWRPGDVLRFELDTSPRLTYPDRRIEAVQGAVAIERGPLVYCLEQADQPAGIDLVDLALVPGQLEDARATLPGVGDTVLVRARAVHRPGPQHAGLPYRAAAGGAQAGGAQADGRRPRGLRRPGGHGHGPPVLPVGQPGRTPHAGLDPGAQSAPLAPSQPARHAPNPSKPT